MSKYVVCKGSEKGMERLPNGAKQKDFETAAGAIAFAVEITKSDMKLTEIVSELTKEQTARIETEDGFVQITEVPDYVSSSFMFICPNHKNHRRFVTTAHVVQDWIVDECGDFQEVVEDCSEVASDPCVENTWTCNKCGKEAFYIEL